MKLSIALITLFAGVAASADVQRLRSSSLHASASRSGLDEAVDMYLGLDAAAGAEIQPRSRRHLQGPEAPDAPVGPDDPAGPEPGPPGPETPPTPPGPPGPEDDDTVLPPPLPGMSMPTTTVAPEGPKTIVEIAVASGYFTTLVAALEAAGLVEALSGDGPFTVLAPTDNAFAKLPAGTVESLLADIPLLSCILTSHVILGNVPSSDVTTGPVKALSGHELAAVVGTDGITFDDAKVIAADIVASNGVIHVLDSVIVPTTCTDPATPDEPAVLPAMSMPTTTVAPEGPKTIVEIAVASGSFTTLVAALEAAGLVEALSGDGPFTVLAPTDDAFAKLPAGTVESLLADIPLLSCILTSHVILGNVPSSDVTTGPVKALSGHELAAVVGPDGITFDDAKVIAADILASNGVIHVLDSVIVPETCAPDEPAVLPATTTAATAAPPLFAKSAKSKTSKASTKSAKSKTLKDPMAKVAKSASDAKAEKVAKASKAKSAKSKSTKASSSKGSKMFSASTP